DHDDDLDVVVAGALSGDTVGVWLNDGHGRFTSVDIHQFPERIRALETLRSTADTTDASVCGSERRGEHPGLLVARLPRSPSLVLAISARQNAHPWTLLSTARGPRAPPPLSTTFSS